MLRDIGFIACSELVEAIVRYHHSTLKSSDFPTGLSSDILRCVNIALACNRLEELVYGPDPCPKKEALEAIRAETEERVLASRGSRAPRKAAVKLAEAPSPLSLERPMAGRV